MKELDSYIFTSEANHCKPLDRVAIYQENNARNLFIYFLVNLISLVIASGLAISHSYGKIQKRSSLLNKSLVIKD